MSIRGRGITILVRVRSDNVIRVGHWPSALARLSRDKRLRFKAGAPRITRKLMRPGTPWEANLQRVAEEIATERRAEPIRKYCGVGPGAARQLAAVGLDWRDLCIPLSDPHRCIAQEFEDGVLTLAEVHGIATVGMRRDALGFERPRVAGLDGTEEASPRWRLRLHGRLAYAVRDAVARR